MKNFTCFDIFSLFRKLCPSLFEGSVREKEDVGSRARDMEDVGARVRDIIMKAIKV